MKERDRSYFLQNLNMVRSLENQNYLVAIFKPDKNNKKEVVVLIEKATGENRCELFKEEDGSLVGGILGKEIEQIFETEKNFKPFPKNKVTPNIPSWMLRSKKEVLNNELKSVFEGNESDMDRVMDDLEE